MYIVGAGFFIKSCAIVVRNMSAHKMLYLEGNIFGVVCKSYWHTQTNFHTSKRMRTCAVSYTEIREEHKSDIKASVETSVVREKCISLICFFKYYPPLALTTIF